MNINDIASNLTASLPSTGSSRTRSSGDADPVTTALKQANDRLDQQRKTSEVKLSAYGQVKSAVAELQSSSKKLTDSTNTDTADEAKKAAQNFVNAFNNARAVANRAINGDKSGGGELANEGRARIAANELSRALDRTATNELKSIGITANKDGSLKIDAQKFEQAQQSRPQEVAAALENAGQQAEQAANRQLQNNGNVTRSINALSNQVRDMEAQQAQRQNLADAMQRATEEANTRINAASASGIAAYQKILSM